MMHRNRRWCLNPVATTEDLARMLTERTWTLCSAFYVQGHENYIFVNDATHEDGAGEYGALHRTDAGHYMQIESITFSWCSYSDALRYLQQALAGAMDMSDFARPVAVRLETPAQHGRCHLCA